MNGFYELPPEKVEALAKQHQALRDGIFKLGEDLEGIAAKGNARQVVKEIDARLIKLYNESNKPLTP